MYLFKLTCSDDDYQTVHWDIKTKVKTNPSYPGQGDSTLDSEHHWRYSSNDLAGAKRRLVNMAVWYHSEQESHTCPFIQKRDKMRSLGVIVAIYWSKRPLFSSFWQMGSIDLFANLECLLGLSDPPIDRAIHSRHNLLLTFSDRVLIEAQ